MNSRSSQNLKTVMLAGATGYIGSYVLELLLSRGHRVVTIGRTASKNRRGLGNQHINVDICSAKDMKELSTSIPPIDAVISCIGSRTGVPKDSWEIELTANQNILSLSQSRGAKQFVLLSAICVQRPRLEFQMAKLAFEDCLIASGITYTIVRPTAYFKSLAGQIKNVQAGKAFIVFDDGARTSCKPISGDDLAEFICDCMDLTARWNKILPVGGPGPAITLKEQGELIFQLLDMPIRIWHVPSRLFVVIDKLLWPFGFFSEKLSDKRELLRIGYYYATESMLAWDKEKKKYSTEKTPEYGSDTLESFYSQVLEAGLSGHELGTHKLF